MNRNNATSYICCFCKLSKSTESFPKSFCRWSLQMEFCLFLTSLAVFSQSSLKINRVASQNDLWNCDFIWCIIQKINVLLSKHRGAIHLSSRPCKLSWQRSDLNCAEAVKVDFSLLWNCEREREDIFKLSCLYFDEKFWKKVEDLNYKFGIS